MSDVDNFKMVEIRNFARTFDEVVEIADHFLGKDTIITHLSEISHPKNGTLGFVFHTDDPSPDHEASLLSTVGDARVIAEFLGNNLAEMAVSKPPVALWEKGWTFKLTESGTCKSLSAIATYVVDLTDEKTH